MPCPPARTSSGLASWSARWLFAAALLLAAFAFARGEELRPRALRVLHVDASDFPQLVVYIAPGAEELALDEARFYLSEDDKPLLVQGITEQVTRLNLALLLDEPEPRSAQEELARAALAELGEWLGYRDRLAVVPVAQPEQARGFFRRGTRPLALAGGQGGSERRAYDALAAAWKLCARCPGRSAIVALLCGPDNISVAGVDDLRQVLAYSPAPLFIFALWPEADRTTLASLAAATGGAAYFPQTPEEAKQAAAAVGELLNRVVGLRCRSLREVRDGSWREVRASLGRAIGAQQQRRGYFAPARRAACATATIILPAPPPARATDICLLLDRATGRLRAWGLLGEPFLAPPGSYDVHVLCRPPVRAELELRAGEQAELTLPPAGALVVYLPENLRGQPLYDVEDESTGEHVAAGRDGRPLVLGPGRYRIVSRGEPTVRFAPATVRAGELATVDLRDYGAVVLQVLDRGGEPIIAHVELKLPFEANVVASGTTNAAIQTQAGIYMATIRTDPLVTVPYVEVEAGKTRTLPVARFGSLLVKLASSTGAPYRAPWAATTMSGQYLASGETNADKPMYAVAARVRVAVRPPREFTTRVRSGEQTVVDMGQLAGLRIVAKLPDGRPLRAKFLIFPPGRSEPFASGITAAGPAPEQWVEDFLPGTYDVEVRTVPPLRLAGLRLSAGRVRTVELEQLGGVLVEAGRDKLGDPLPLRYALALAQSGRRVGVFSAGEMVPVRRGEYLAESVGLSPRLFLGKLAISDLGEQAMLRVVCPEQPKLPFVVCRAQGEELEPIAEGRAGEDLALPPGSYELRVPRAFGVTLPSPVRALPNVLTLVVPPALVGGP